MMREVDRGHYRSVIGHFATGVAVITATGPDGPVGMTANAVCSLSLDPLLLLVCFDRGARTLPVVRERGRFGVNVLAAGQEELGQLFAGKLPEHEKFAGVAHSVHDDIPVIDDVLCWVGCALERLEDGGDHVIGIGRVEAAELPPEGHHGQPLLWYQGRFGSLA